MPRRMSGLNAARHAFVPWIALSMIGGCVSLTLVWPTAGLDSRDALSRLAVLTIAALAAHGLALAWRRWCEWSALWLLVGAGLIGAARTAWDEYTWHRTLESLGAVCGSDRHLVCVDGIVTSKPRCDESLYRDELLRCDSYDDDVLSPFVPQSPSIRFTLAVDSMRDEFGKPHLIDATVRVSVEGLNAGCVSGDRVSLVGWLSPCELPRNPGGFNSLAWGRSRGVAAILAVESHALVTTLRNNDLSLVTLLARWRSCVDATMQRALGTHDGFSAEDRGERLDVCALIAASTTGAAWPGLRSVSKAFAACGVQHLVAISGFNFAILASCALWGIRRCSNSHRVGGVALVALACLFVASIESEVSSIRAALMGGSSALALTFNRTLPFGSVVGGAAIVIVLCDPAAASEPGFQLSFAAIMGLHFVSPVLTNRLQSLVRGFGLRATLTRLALVPVGASVAAWSATAPIVAIHFGSWPLLCVPCTLVLSPCFAAMVVSANAMVVLEPLAPPLARTARVVAALNARCILTVVRACSTMPGALDAYASVRVIDSPGDALIRIDMLDVGNGSCYLVRSGASTVVFDCGSLGAPAVGSRVIVPALRALGVTSVDVVVISHPNLDHYGGLPEIVRDCRVRRVLVTPQFLKWSEHSRAAACALDSARALGASIETTARGDAHPFGDAVWRVIHPVCDGHFADSNDGSLIVRVDQGLFSLLLTGDSAREACADILRSPDQHQLEGITVMELPHHGSFRPESAALATRVSSAVVLQSTGARRLLRDVWGPLLDPAIRLVTARDNACALVWNTDGSLVVGAWDGAHFHWRQLDHPIAPPLPLPISDHEDGTLQVDHICDRTTSALLELYLELARVDWNTDLHDWIWCPEVMSRKLMVCLPDNDHTVAPRACRWWHLCGHVECCEPLGDFVDEPQRPPDFERRGGEGCVTLLHARCWVFRTRKRWSCWRGHRRCQ